MGGFLGAALGLPEDYLRVLVRVWLGVGFEDVVVQDF